MSINNKDFLVGVTKDIGKVHLKYFPHVNRLKSKVKTKYFNDIVTSVDLITEKLVIKKLKKVGYKGTLLMEETGEIKFGNEDKRIIIDSLDGTFFYSKGLYNFCVATAMEEKGKCMLATVYNPATNEFFLAERGKGAFLNGKRIKVSKTKNPEKSTIVLSAFPNHEIEKLQRIFLRLMTSGGLRLLEHVLNLNLCYIANGRFDGYISFYSTLPEWDKLPGILILEEAGGKITDFSGNEIKKDSTKFVASNNKLHKDIMKIVE